MGKAPKTILFILLVIVILALIAFGALYFTRFKTISTIEKLTDYEDGYNLYSMTVQYDYDPQSITGTGFTDTQGFVEGILKDSLPMLPVRVTVPSFGCSAYRAYSDGGDTLMGRNYDFKLNTSCMLVRCAPKNGYRSIGFAALSNISVDRPELSLATKMACLTAPYLCLDGVNEKGVSIAVLTLDSDPTIQNTGKDHTASGLIIREVLDHAATTQEAVDLFAKYDMIALNGRDYHFFVSDANGDSRVIEYDCEDAGRAMTVTPMPAITNFFAMYIDKVESHQRNGIYGHGKERYDAMMEILEPKDFRVTAEEAWAPLMAAATEPNPESVTSNTQWSIVFNNTKGTADITLRRHWDDRFSFAID